MNGKSLIIVAMTAVLLSACGNNDSGGGNPQTPATYNMADYFPLMLPSQANSCVITKEEVAGNNIGSTTTSTFDASTETINYTSGALTGTVVTDDGGNSVVYRNDGNSLKILRYMDDIFSTDCDLTAHPDAFSFGAISDGMVKSISNFSKVSKADNTQCTSIPIAGGDPGNKALYRIADVLVRGTTFQNAIIEYWLDLDINYVTLQYNGGYGIPLPTSVETQGNSITDISIYAFGEGEVAHLGVDAATGTITDITERSDFSCQ